MRTLPFKKTGTITVNQKRLDDFWAEHPLQKPANVMVLDIQGAELMALEGATHTLKDIDAIVTEVSCTELYKGCALIEDLDAFLLNQGFRRVNTIVNMFSWGDALYVRKQFLTQKPRAS
ncbi:FkbM family methyltransferase [bacterium NHP-B]|nr:FkbM family methyltransferase [bacterium NHP-B]